ncbi:hypothetical protein SO694_00023111 [Aureococcus anophagefferens]|uniref:Uncharacterized protein n=1 Tax=Aureococcus anophagefferens TaxID=44056 RepID=A0ABR1FTU2_AURAN
MVDKVPLVWSASAVYAGVGLAASSYYLVTLDASEACYKCRTDAWGAARQLEGLDELLGWLEWSAMGVGADVAPKLVAAFGAERCAVAGLASAVEDVRSASAGALAALTHDDELARRVAASTCAVATLVDELERVADPPASPSRAATPEALDAAEHWADLYARRVAVLVSLGNLTRDAAGVLASDDDLAPRLADALFVLLESLRDAREATDAAAAARRRVCGGAQGPRRRARRCSAPGRRTSAVRAPRHDRRARGVGAPRRAPRRRRAERRGGAPGPARRAPLLADLAWAEGRRVALHANFALYRALGGDSAEAAALDAPPPELGVAAGLDARARCRARARRVRAAPLAFAAGWGAVRRAWVHSTSQEAFLKAVGFSLPRAAASAAAATAAASAALTALYGARGFRYEARRSFFAEGDAAQIALSATVVSADLAVLFVALRVAPFCVFPFLVANVLA